MHHDWAFLHCIVYYYLGQPVFTGEGKTKAEAAENGSWLVLVNFVREVQVRKHVCALDVLCVDDDGDDNDDDDD